MSVQEDGNVFKKLLSWVADVKETRELEQVLAMRAEERANDRRGHFLHTGEPMFQPWGASSYTSSEPKKLSVAYTIVSNVLRAKFGYSSSSESLLADDHPEKELIKVSIPKGEKYISTDQPPAVVIALFKEIGLTQDKHFTLTSHKAPQTTFFDSEANVERLSTETYMHLFTLKEGAQNVVNRQAAKAIIAEASKRGEWQESWTDKVAGSDAQKTSAPSK